MNESRRFLHLWRYALIGLRMELILFYLALAWYVFSPYFIPIRRLGRTEEMFVPALMAATVWLAGRIMLIDPLPRMKASWRIMPWTVREMAWGRAGFVVAAVFLPWLAAHAARLLMLRPDAGVFFSAMGNPLCFWPVIGASALVAGLNRSLLGWLLTPVAAIGLLSLVELIKDHTGIFSSTPFQPPQGDWPWQMHNPWMVAKSYTLAVALGTLVTLGGLISLAWPRKRLWACSLITLMGVLTNTKIDSIVNYWKPHYPGLERVTFPITGGTPNAAVYDGVSGLEPGEFLEIAGHNHFTGFGGRFTPESGERLAISVTSSSGPPLLFGRPAHEIPGAIWSNSFTKSLRAAPPVDWNMAQPFKIGPVPGVLDVNIAYDVCRMEMLADWPLEQGITTRAIGQRMQLEKISLTEQSVTASILMECTEVMNQNLLRKHRIPGDLIFALVMKDGIMIRDDTENGYFQENYVTKNFLNGHSVRVFGLKWSGILTDPWQSGAAVEWMEGCRLRIYTSISQGLAHQRIKRRIERFPEQ